MNFNKLSIIIPVYNEGKTVSKILDKVKTVDLIKNIQKEVILTFLKNIFFDLTL
jgi:glycosyltransferase involved in cell wall biosynthesis